MRAPSRKGIGKYEFMPPVGATTIGSEVTSGIVANLATGSVTGGAGNDLLIGIESVWATAYADTLTGDGGDNQLIGYDGDDLLVGGPGNDALNGGVGIDTADYSSAPGAVFVALYRDNTYDISRVVLKPPERGERPN